MSEERMIELIQGALDARGIDDRVASVGQFNPRGHTGGMFAGGLVAGDAGGVIGGVAEGVGVAAGSLAGARATDAASGLPAKMLVGVSDTMVYGFAAATRHSEPTALAFQLPRGRITAKVHQRVNVRVLELIDNASGSRIELEGSRLPVTHSKDVIQALTGSRWLAGASPDGQPSGEARLHGDARASALQQQLVRTPSRRSACLASEASAPSPTEAGITCGSSRPVADWPTTSISSASISSSSFICTTSPRAILSTSLLGDIVKSLERFGGEQSVKRLRCREDLLLRWKAAVTSLRLL